MEEEKAAALYDELTRKGEGAARFKQGLGFSSASNKDAVPSRSSALPIFSSSSSFLSTFVKASSPSKTAEIEKQAQLESIQNKLKKKQPRQPPQNLTTTSTTRGVSRDRDSNHSSRRSRSRDNQRSSRRRSRDKDRRSKRQSRSRSRDRDSHSRRRSRSRSRDDNRARRGYRSRSRERERERERGRERSRRNRSSCESPTPQGKREKNSTNKLEKESISRANYAELIEGYDKMIITREKHSFKTSVPKTPADKVKAKMKLQLSETAKKDETKGMGSGWERFDFDKDAPLDDEEIEAVEDDAALVKHIGQSFRFATVEARRDKEIKAAHDEAMFGASSLPPATETDEEGESKNIRKEMHESVTVNNLLSDQVFTMQQGSWRDRVRKL